MTTTLEAPTSSRRLDLLIWWLDNRPAECGLTVTDLEPVIAKVAGHPVDPLVVEDLVCAFALPASTTDEQDERRERVEQVVERLTDITSCGTCDQMIPETAGRVECPVLAASYCHDECHGEAHGATFGSCFCSALDER